MIETDLNNHILIVFNWKMHQEGKNKITYTEDDSYLVFNRIELRNDSGTITLAQCKDINDPLIDVKKLSNFLLKDNYSHTFRSNPPRPDQFHKRIMLSDISSEIHMIIELLKQCVEPSGNEIFESIIKFKDFNG